MTRLASMFALGTLQPSEFPPLRSRRLGNARSDGGWPSLIGDRHPGYALLILRVERLTAYDLAAPFSCGFLRSCEREFVAQVCRPPR